MNFVKPLLFLFFLSVNAFAYNSENSGKNFNHLPLEIKKQILLFHTDSYRNFPLVNKEWNNTISTYPLYECEKYFKSLISKLKEGLENKSLDDLFNVVIQLSSGLNYYDDNSSFLFKSGQFKKNWHLFHPIDLLSLKKKDTYINKISIPINKIISDFLDETFINGLSRFHYFSPNNDIYVFLTHVLNLNLINTSNVQKITSWILSDFDKIKINNSDSIYAPLFKKILEHPNCSEENVSKLFKNLIHDDTHFEIKRNIYEGMSFQKKTPEKILISISNDLSFWAGINKDNSSFTKKIALKIYINLFLNSRIFFIEGFEEKLWKNIQKEISNFSKNDFSSSTFEDLAFYNVIENLILSPQLSSESKIDDLLSYIQYFNSKEQILFLTAFLNNNKISLSILENKIYSSLENLLLSNVCSFSAISIDYISKALILISDQQFSFSLVQKILEKIESFDTQLEFVGRFSDHLNRKNLNNLYFDLTTDFLSSITPTFLKLSQDQQFLFLKILYKSSNSVSKQELEKTLSSPQCSPLYISLLGEVIEKFPSHSSLEEQQHLWNVVHQSLQGLSKSENVKKIVYINLTRSFFKNFPKSLFLNETLKEIKSWTQSTAIKNYGIYIFSNLEFVQLGFNPLFDQLIEDIHNENAHLLILNRLNNKLNFDCDEIFNDSDILLSIDISQEMTNFFTSKP